MKTADRVQRQRMLVEEIGRSFDKQGFSPIAGRILGLLMVMDQEQFTFDEIVDALQISKSSASVALRNLELRGNVEYVTLPGDRKRYFRIKTLDPFDLIKDLTQRMVDYRDLQEKILELKADKASRNARFFMELRRMIDFIVNNLEELKEQYRRQ